MPAPRKALHARRQRLTLAQLAAYDDILTDVLVDHVFYWTSVPKNRSSYRPSRGVHENVITKIVQEDVVINKDVEGAERKLLKTDGLRQFHDGLRTDQERQDFRRHLLRYLHIYLPDCPWEVGSTNIYTIFTHEACIMARIPIRRNETIRYLSGIQVNITPEEEKEIAGRKKDFSIVVSSRNKCTSLFMGPARFANHDCRANAKLMTTGQAGIEIIATRPIHTGEEITVSYGENYFGENNCECLCRTCEKSCSNGWAPEPGTGTAVKDSIEGTEQELEADKTESYSLRRRPCDRSSVGAASRTASVVPVIRPRVYKTRRTEKILSLNQFGESLAANTQSLNASSPRGRRRSLDVTETPQATPAKRLKKMTEGSIVSRCVVSSRGSVSDSTTPCSGGDAVDTDVTSPDGASPEPHGDADIESGIKGLKKEDVDSVDYITLIDVAPISQHSLCEDRPAALNGLSSSAEVIADLMTVSAILNPLPSDELKAIVVATMSDETVEDSQAPQVADGRFENGKEKGVRRRKLQGRHFMKQTTPPARLRTPGDYVLTPLLLSEPEMAWIQCTNCSSHFVQQNAYFTRSACPRCERHSKLYGYIWPKTEKAGRWDTEERILDHRTVHRFLGSQEERQVRRRRPMNRKETDDISIKVQRKVARQAKQQTADYEVVTRAKTRADVGEDAGHLLRRSGRARKTSRKLVP